jgi:hypothetical protein
MMRMSSFILFIALTLLSCTPAEPTIEFGKAECAHCRMNVVDRQYGAALVTEKGRQYVFDDVSCMVHFVAKGTVAEGQVIRLVCVRPLRSRHLDRCHHGAVPPWPFLPQSDAG